MKYIVYLAFLLFVLQNDLKSQDYSCIRNNLPEFYKLEKVQLINWRRDINGCFNFRKSLLDSLVNNKAIIGMPKELFILLFGKADVISEEKNVLIYYVNCKCDSNKNHLTDSDVIQAAFIFIDKKLDSIEVAMT